MTMREKFEYWHTYTREPRELWEAWQAAYRAGQEDMRERAAKAVDIALIVSDIRALPID